MVLRPRLKSELRGGIRLLTDPAARAAGLLVAFTDREGGASSRPYASLNLSVHVGDEEEAVKKNRRLVLAAAGFDESLLVLARQVHGNEIIEAVPGASGEIGTADGLMVRRHGPVLGVLTADCVPVILAGPEGVGVVHAGWRGIVAGVIERGIKALGVVRAAWVGPCIHSCCYEVGPEVLEAFRDAELPVAASDRVDPGEAAVACLRRAGVTNYFMAGECTHCDARYFSHRRDGTTGRQGALVAMLAPHLPRTLEVTRS